MNSKQLVDYIAEQRKAGHSQVTVRSHLLKHGWQRADVDKALKQYERSASRTMRSSISRPRAHAARLRRRRIRLLTVCLALVIAVVAWSIVSQRAASKLPPTTVRILSQSERQSLDISTIGGAVGQYAAEYQTLPLRIVALSDNVSIELCGNVCTPNQSVVSSLGSFPAQDVTMHPYETGLRAPDAHTVYVVPNATCASKLKLGSATSKPRTAVILYAVSDGVTLQQRCVTL